MAVWSGFAGAGGVLGLVGSGALLERFWWGSIFVVTAALAVVAWVAALVIVPATRTARPPVDLRGALLSIRPSAAWSSASPKARLAAGGTR